MNTPFGEGTVHHLSVGVAIPAAGSGRRMGGVRKPLLELAGEPILLHALRPFLDHPQVQALAIAMSAEDLQEPPEWLKGLDSRIRMVAGGETRTESVWSALKALPATLDLVAIHDAARPLVTRSMIDRCLAAAGRDQGAVAGWPAVDTLKKVGREKRISTTLMRDEVWHAQTPQVFPREMILSAYEKAIRGGVFDTDDAALVERMGGVVVMVEGGPFNLKVTQPGDLPLAEYLLRAGKE